jgi:hypothetical protein
MDQMRAESHVVAASEPCADGGCGRCVTTIAGEPVHACLLSEWLRVEMPTRSQIASRQAGGIRAAVERTRPMRIAIGGPVLRRCRSAEDALERGANLRSALEVDVGGLCGPAADLILPLIR